MQRTEFDNLTYEDDCTYTLDGLRFSGIAFDCWPGGGIRGEMTFVDGHVEGISRSWYQSGQLENELNYLGEGLHGICRWWYPTGRLKAEGLYEYAIRLHERRYDENGVLMEEKLLDPTDSSHGFLELKRKIWGPSSLGTRLPASSASIE